MYTWSAILKEKWKKLWRKKEREEFSLKLKQQSRRVSDLEIKDKRQQDEVR